jgi:hypothetical protein
MEKIVISYSNIEEIPVCNTGRVVVVIFGSSRGYPDEVRTVL